MPTFQDRFIVLTGGPGSGKTTLIEALSARGFKTSREVGRQIIREQREIGGSGLPWADTRLFAELMLSREMQQYEAMGEHAGPVFFDRGLPDVAGYLDLLGGPVPAHVRAAAERYRYAERVFLLPPWPEIFGEDEERKQDLAEAERTFEAMCRTYGGLGHTLVTIPKASVEERVSFLMEQLGRSDFLFAAPMD